MENFQPRPVRPVSPSYLQIKDWEQQKGIIMESQKIIDATQEAGVSQSTQYEPPKRHILGFIVRIVDNAHDLQRVRQLRSLAYGHHLPLLAEQFGKEDPLDEDPDVVIFCAEDKATGNIVGSCRVQVNRNRPLQIQSCIEEPEHLRGRVMAEITRLVVHPNYGDRYVRMALSKACHLYNIGTQVSGVYAGARAAMLRQYKLIGFTDLYEDKREVPLTYAGNMPHRILWIDSVSAEGTWAAQKNPFHEFAFRTWHPDIMIFAKAFTGIARHSTHNNAPTL